MLASCQQTDYNIMEQLIDKIGKNNEILEYHGIIYD